MRVPEQYESDKLFFFDGRPAELALYEALAARMADAFPAASVRVQKSQISFYGRRLFAMASLPTHRGKRFPEHCILVSFGLSYRNASPRIAIATEPYPQRWTHHVPISKTEQLDGELMGWLAEAWEFSEKKGRRTT